MIKKNQTRHRGDGGVMLSSYPELNMYLGINIGVSTHEQRSQSKMKLVGLTGQIFKVVYTKNNGQIMIKDNKIVGAEKWHGFSVVDPKSCTYLLKV